MNDTVLIIVPDALRGFRDAGRNVGAGAVGALDKAAQFFCYLSFENHLFRRRAWFLFHQHVAGIIEKNLDEHYGEFQRLVRVHAGYPLVILEKVWAMNNTVIVTLPNSFFGFGNLGVEWGAGAVGALDKSAQFLCYVSYWFHVSSGGNSLIGLP